MPDIAGERARLRGQGLQMVHREQWGARQSYTSDRRVNRPASWLFLHISVTAAPSDNPAAEQAACRAVESIGQQRFGIGCSYNAAAMQSGRLYELQPLTRRGAHTVNDLPNPHFPRGSLNYSARALVLVQNVGDAVTDAQIDAAARWGAALCRSGEAVRGARWFGHRDVTRKACPGDKAYARLAELNRLTRHYEAHGLGAPEEDTFMAALTDAQQKELYRQICGDPSESRLGEVTKAVRALKPQPPGYFAKAGDDGTVYYVDAAHQSKVPMQVGGDLHEWLKALHRISGFNERAVVVDRQVLDAIPDSGF